MCDQTDYYVQYVNPESHAVRAYYHDFIAETADGAWFIVEVKGDNKIGDPVVQAKETYTRQFAASSDMRYRIIHVSDYGKGLASSVREGRSGAYDGTQPRLPSL